MLVTKLSTKGQVVIPAEIRNDLDSGATFAVTRKNDLIVLKRLRSYTKKELLEIGELDEIWKRIESGKASRKSKEAFLRELDSW